MWKPLTHRTCIDVVFEVEIRAKFARQDDEKAETNIIHWAASVSDKWLLTY